MPRAVVVGREAFQPGISGRSPTARRPTDGKLVVHRIADALGMHHVMAFEHGEMLRQQRRFDVQVGEDLADRGRLCVRGQDLKDPNARGVSQRLEQIGLDFIQRTFRAASRKPPGGLLGTDPHRNELMD